MTPRESSTLQAQLYNNGISLVIITLSFAYFCDYAPHDGTAAETCC